METIAKELCSDYTAEAWRIGFAAGCAFTIWLVVAYHVAMRILRRIRASKGYTKRSGVPHMAPPGVKLKIK